MKLAGRTGPPNCILFHALLRVQQTQISPPMEALGKISGSYGDEYENVSPCFLVESEKRFRGACCLYHQCHVQQENLMSFWHQAGALSRWLKRMSLSLTLSRRRKEERLFHCIIYQPSLCHHHHKQAN
jgi:hypothetical protein